MNDYEKYIPIMKEGIESDYKIIAIILPHGYGKTTYATLYSINNNKNNAIYLNNHALKFELYKDLILDKFREQLKVHFLLNITYGKQKIISEEERLFTDYPSCACLLFDHNRDLWKIMGLGFLHSDYCKKKCVYRYYCIHKQLNKDIFNSLKLDSFHIINILMKSHIQTELTSGYLEQAEFLEF